MSDKISAFLFGMAVGAWVIVLLDMAFTPDYRVEAVEHGCAHYDSKTGEWQWNEAAE